jgi:hypothetical protein
MADKIKKNLLGRNVTVKREVMSDGSLSKTRTVKSKSGGTISSKTNYKDPESLAGKLRAKKMGPATGLQSYQFTESRIKTDRKKLPRDVRKVVKNSGRSANLNTSEEMAQLAALRGAKNAGKVVQRVKEGPVKRIGLKVTKKG